MILGIVWEAYSIGNPSDIEVDKIMSYEPIRTLTTERLEYLKKENNLMFDDEWLYYDDATYNEYKKHRKMKIATNVISDENFDQYMFGMNKSDFIKWCKGE